MKTQNDKNYCCKVCDYYTPDSGNYHRHLKTSKHKKKKYSQLLQVEISDDELAKISQRLADCLPVQKEENNKSEPIKELQEYPCIHCNLVFRHRSSLSKHNKKCSNKILQDTLLKKDLEIAKREIEMLKEKNETEIKQRTHLEKVLLSQIENYKELVMDSKKGNLSNSGLIYKHFGDNPPLEKVEPKKLDGFIGENSVLIDEIICYSQHKVLHEFLSKFLLTIYKKKNILKQSIFSTDTSRLTYMVKELLFDETSEWILDKKGVKVTSLIIEPVTEYVRELVVDYYHDIKIPEEPTIDDIRDYNQKKKDVIELLNLIDDGFLNNQINKFICPYLSIDKTKVKQISKNKNLPGLDFKTNKKKIKD